MYGDQTYGDTFKVHILDDPDSVSVAAGDTIMFQEVPGAGKGGTASVGGGSLFVASSYLTMPAILNHVHPPGTPAGQGIDWIGGYNIDTLGTYDIGTVAIAPDAGGSIVTLSDPAVTPPYAFWPQAGIAGGTLTVSGTDYEVLSRSSDSVILLVDTNVTVGAGTAFSLELTKGMGYTEKGGSDGHQHAVMFDGNEFWAFSLNSGTAQAP
jgi:hypothetical protein